MELSQQLNKIASDRQAGGNQDAGLALAALVLLDKDNNIVLDGSDMSGTLGRLGWPRYLGMFASKNTLDDYLTALDVLPRPGDWGIIFGPAITPGIFFDHLANEITTPVMFVIVDSQTFAGQADWPAYTYTPLGTPTLYPALPPGVWKRQYYFLHSRVMKFKGADGTLLGGYYVALPIDTALGNSEMHITFQDPQYKLAVYSEQQPGHPNDYTEANYYSDSIEGVYILNASEGGDSIDNEVIGPPTASNRFDPAVGFYDA